MKIRKKVYIIAFDVILIAFMLFVIGFASSKKEEVLCSGVNIIMVDTLKAGFLTKRDVEKILFSDERKILGYPASSINTHELELLFEEIPYVKKAEAYYNLEGTLSLEIYQREPIVRVMTRSNRSYYLDTEGNIIPDRTDFTPHVLVANGHFSEGRLLSGSRNIEMLKAEKQYLEWLELFEIAVYIHQHSFWKSQIVQVYFNRSGEFELIPRVGAHQVIFGRTEDIAGRFRKLEILYEEGLKYEGWNKYEKINLEYNNQVICTKR